MTNWNVDTYKQSNIANNDTSNISGENDDDDESMVSWYHYCFVINVGDYIDNNEYFHGDVVVIFDTFEGIFAVNIESNTMYHVTLCYIDLFYVFQYSILYSSNYELDILA